MNNPARLSRRSVSAGLLTVVAMGLVPLRAIAALTTDQASRLIGSLVGDISNIINSGRSEAAMYGDFERVLTKYADMNIIAQSALGADGRSATASQRAAFTKAFRGYLARKYGKRFREFIGGQVEVTGTRAVKSFYEVTSITKLRGSAPFEVRWLVSDKSGRTLFFNMIVEGVNMVLTERTEIGAMLDARKGNLDKLISDLRRLG